MNENELLEKVKLLLKEYAESNGMRYEADVFSIDRTVDNLVRVIDTNEMRIFQFIIQTPDEDEMECWMEYLDNNEVVKDE